MWDHVGTVVGKGTACIVPPRVVVKDDPCIVLQQLPMLRNKQLSHKAKYLHWPPLALPDSPYP